MKFSGSSKMGMEAIVGNQEINKTTKQDQISEHNSLGHPE